MPYQVIYTNQSAREFAEENLNETDENKCNAIAEITSWIENTKGLNARKDDQSILAFLRGCKFNTKLAKQKMMNFYVMKLERPEWFANRDPNLKEVEELIDLGVFIPLKKYHNNKLVVIIRTAVHDPKVHKQDNVFKAGKMILDLAIAENFENATIYGICAVFDMANVSLAHARQLPPHVIKKAVFAWQNYHCRPKQLEFVNAPIYVNVVLNVFKSFMSEKLQGRVRVHFKGTDSLHQVVPKEVLPLEYGGTEGHVRDLIQYWKKKSYEYKDWFRDDEQYKAELILNT